MNTQIGWFCLRIHLSPVAALLAATTSLVSCGGNTSWAPLTPIAPSERRNQDTDRFMTPAQLRAEQHRLNERARTGAVTEALHGQSITDPFRGLEADTASTREWIEAQSRAAVAELDAPNPVIEGRLDALLSIGSISDARATASAMFYQKRDGAREHAVVFARTAELPTPTLIIDPHTFGERASLDWYYPSPTGRLVAFGISQNGDERSVLHVYDVAAGRLREERIENAKWSSVAWLNDESGFYFTRYPLAGEEHYDEQNLATYFPAVYFHRIGTPADLDVKVLGTEDGAHFLAPHIGDDDRYLIVVNQRGWSRQDVMVFDRGTEKRIAPDASHPFRNVVAEDGVTAHAFVARGKLWLRTNANAPKYKVRSAPLARIDDGASWTDVVPEGATAIEDWTFFAGGFALHTIDDVHSRVKIFDDQGHERGDVPFAERGAVDSLSGSLARTDFSITWSSVFVPPHLLSFDTSSSTLRVDDRIDAPIDISRYQLTQERVQSADGTLINVFVAHRRDLPRDGSARAILTGYGGFNVPILPSFVRHALYWLETGGVFAFANLRGGSEFGEAWHRAGNLENKERVFEDFEAATRWLSSSGFSSPDRLAITGGSNGGLLMGALITRSPQLFAVATSYVGLYDMVRYHRFPPAELWITEYGSADDPEQFQWLYRYSPYHRVRAGTQYPAVLIETATNDSRVFWGHSTKFAAALQEATSSTRPVLFYREENVGHGVGTSRSDLVKRYVRMYSFLESQLAR